MYELFALGFGPFFEQQIRPSGGEKVATARIAAEHRGAYEVWSTTGAGRAQLAQLPQFSHSRRFFRGAFDDRMASAGAGGRSSCQNTM